MVAEPMDAFEQPQVIRDRVADAMSGSCRTLYGDAAHGMAQTRVRRTAVNGPAPVAPGKRLAAAIEAALVPRLVLAHGGHSNAGPQGASAALRSAVELFTTHLVADDDGAAAMALLRRFRDQGATEEALCLDLLAPAARRLGELWEQDDCDFALVTLGLSRLHRALHDVSPASALDLLPSPDPRRAALLAVVPGEQHVFGLAMVGEFLRRAGWEVFDAVGATHSELLQLVRHTAFSVAALSASSDARLEPLAAMISAIRSGSRNQRVAVMVGGRAFEHPRTAIRVGADAMALDARQAVAQAERLLSKLEVGLHTP